MYRKKRVMSFLAALTFFAVSFLHSAPAFAEDAGAEITETDRRLVEKLEAFGAITNEYEDIGMYVSRRQMAEIIVHFMRLQTSGGDGTASPFVDVPPEDSSIDAIITLYRLGVVSGDETLQFHPDRAVTVHEAVVFVINAVGHKLFAVKEGGYPMGYLKIAARLNLFAKTDFAQGSDAATLINVYRLLDAALGAGAVIQTNITSAAADYTISDTEDFLSDTYGIRTFKGIVTGNENTRLTNPDSNLSDEQIEIDGVVYDTPGYIYASSLGRSVIYYLKKNDFGSTEIAYIEENERLNSFLRIEAEDLLPAKTTDSNLYYTDDSEKERRAALSNVIDVIYNAKCYSGYGQIEYILPEEGYVELLDNNGDGEIDVLFVYAYKTIVVESVDSYTDTITAKFTGETYSWDTRDAAVELYFAPELHKTSLRALKQWDVVTVLESKGTPKQVTLYVSRNTVTGTVTEVSSEEGYLIDGTFYKKSCDFYGTDLAPGTAAVFYLDANNRIVAADRGSAVPGVKQYAVVSGINYRSASIADDVKVRLFTQEGKFLSIELRNPINIDGARYSLSDDRSIDTVLKLLSQNFKNESGQYAVNSAYVVSYTTAEGKISSIDTGHTGEEGKLRLISTGDYFLSRDNGILRTGESQFEYISYKPDKTYVFSTPADGSLSETDKFSVRRRLNTHTFYKDTGKYGADNATGIQTYDMFDLNTEGIDTAEVILLRGNRTQAGLSDRGSKFKVITKITVAVDEEGNATQKLYMGEAETALLDETVLVKRGNNSKRYHSTDDLSGVLKPGYVIQYGYDISGEKIEAVSIMAEYNAETNTITPVFTEEKLGNTANGYAKASGTVVSCDPARSLITFETPDGTRSMLYAGAASVTVYRPKDERATSGSVSMISEGDTIVARITQYYSANELIVIR